MAAIAVAGVGMMVMCSSSVAAMMMMGGEEKEDPVVPKTTVKKKTPEQIKADEAKAALALVKADPNVTAEEVAAAQLVADNTQAAADAADADADADADAAAAAAAAALPGQVPGYLSAAKSYWKNIQNTPTPEDCRLEAAKEGIPTFIHRNSTHGGAPNSCQLNVWSDKFAGNAEDTVHTQGCTYGGTPENGCTPWPSVMGYQVPGRVGVGDVMNVMNPNECIELGKEKGADVWGYRTKNHGSAPNSCFFFTGTSAYAGDTNDKAHIVGCINGKDIKNGCA